MYSCFQDLFFNPDDSNGQGFTQTLKEIMQLPYAESILAQHIFKEAYAADVIDIITEGKSL